MRTVGFLLLALACAVALTGCSQSDSIDAEGALYDGIAPGETITLSGTEPFWGVTIDPQDDGSYRANVTILGGAEEPSAQPVAVERFAGNNGLGFSGDFEGAPMIIAITPGECSDGMSDRTYPFVATVQMGDASLKGCGYTSATPFAGPEMP